MKIKSRFVDGYDYEQSVDRNDTIIYDRKFSYDKQYNMYHELKYLPKGIFLKVGATVLHVPFDRDNQVLLDYTYMNHKIYKYCKVNKRVELNEPAEIDRKKFLSHYNTTGFGGYGSSISHTEIYDKVGSEYNGDIFVPTGFIEFIYDAKNIKIDNEQINKLFIGQVGLMVITTRTITKVNDFSLIGSGLYDAYQNIFYDHGVNISSMIDANLSTIEEETVLNISNKNKLERHGFDNKVSFRHRKDKK